ncbi:MAG: SAM-dependent chlorinase/fluorinase [Anaerolineae bacterium]|nr:SAM-dependent chlorinase/fluorinase [Anaerolineae bacterium]
MIISITTDFGNKDGYVGTMKGVMAGIAPGVPTIDITHIISPQNVQETAYVLWTALPYFPADAVHLVVVDPGVGTPRRAIAAHSAMGYFVGPDNGVFTYVWTVAPPDKIVSLTNPEFQLVDMSSTFHGRDIFSPAAAYLAAGIDLDSFGPEVENPVMLPHPFMAVNSGVISGTILYIDHFGNCITSIGRLAWRADVLNLHPVWDNGQELAFTAGHTSVTAAGLNLGPIRHTYGEVGLGEGLALVGSEGLLEIATNHGSGARDLGLSTGDPVTVAFT